MRTLTATTKAAADLAAAADAEAAAERERLALRLDVTDVADLLPVGRLAEAAQRSAWIEADCLTMPADRLLLRLQAVTEGTDTVSRQLHFRYAQRRLLAMAEAGQLVRDPAGNLAVPIGADEHLGPLVEAVETLRGSLDGPAERTARLAAETLAVAAGDLQADATRLDFDLTRYGAPGVALSR